MITFLIGVGCGVVLTLLHRHLEDHARSPYRWSCPHPDCDARVKGSEPGMVDRFITLHEEAHS